MHDAFSDIAHSLLAPAPWWVPYLPLALDILTAARSTSTISALNTASERYDAPVRFCTQSELPAGEAYEAFIHRTRCVPTRENAHDLFNALVWLKYPQTKVRLNQLQAEQIEKHGTSGPRGPLRDALTLFDENAAILQAPASLIEALQRKDWQSVFVAQRDCWASARVVVFGHALLEKLLHPRKAITAHVWALNSALEDANLATSVNPERLASKPFLPLPVLGVPGWWSANESPEFYQDVDVFRPPSAKAPQ